MKQSRDELEDGLKDMRDLVKELKDFLSGKHVLTHTVLTFVIML